MKHCLAILLFLWFSYVVRSPLFAETTPITQEQKVVDSLNNNIQKAAEDTARITALLSMATYYYLSNPDTAFYFCEKAKDIAEAAKLKDDMANCYGWLAYLADANGNIPQALKYNFASLEIFKELTSEKEGVNTADTIFIKTQRLLKVRMATVYSNIGYIYSDRGEIDNALKYYFLGFTLREEIEDKKGMAESYTNIGTVYKNQGEIDKGLEYYFSGLKINEELNEQYAIAYSYNNIAGIYLMKREYERALKYYYKSLRFRKEISDKYGRAQSCLQVGEILCEMDSLEKGMKYLGFALTLGKELGFKAGISAAHSTLGKWQLKLGQMESALKNGQDGLSIAQEIGHAGNTAKAAELLSNVYRKNFDFKGALEMYELHIQMRDSIKNEETQKATIRQQTKYEFEKAQLVKEQEEKELARVLSEETSRRDNLQYSIVLIGLLVIGLIVAMLGRLPVPVRVAEGLIFFSFLIFFEFVLVVADPYVDEWTGGAPGWKLLINASIAALIFPAHALFESRLKKRLVKK